MLSEAGRVLAPGGVLAFTLETHGGSGIVLGEGLRYAHSAEYVRDAMAKAGLKLLTLEQASPRTENNEPVGGLVVHKVQVTEGAFRVNEMVQAGVDAMRRTSIRARSGRENVRRISAIWLRVA